MMIRILAKVVIHDIAGFKRLCAILLSENQYKQLANNLLTVYCILKCEADILKGLKYQEIFNLLKLKHFFNKHEEIKILSNQDKIEQLLIVLKDKCLQHIIDFLTYLKELPSYNTLVIKIENEITSLKSDVDSLHSVHIHTAISSLTDSTDISCDTPVRLPANTPLDDFQQYLIQRYNSDNFIRTHNSIRAPKTFHIKLALINNTDNKHFHFSDYSLLHEQDSDRTYLNYSDIFINDQRVVVLQGPPGSGKTTLAKHLCKQWANGKLLQTFSHVIFVQLRDEQIANANSFEDLIKIHMENLSESINREIFKVHGKDFLIILEGWDELPKKRRCKNTIFYRLMSGETLPNAVVMVTTRSSAAVDLPVDACRRIEIIGFSKQQIKQCVNIFLDSYSLITQFWDQLRDLPHIESILFVPINLCIVLNIFQENNQKMPQTCTEIYAKFLLSQLSIFHSKISCHHAEFESLDDLPPEILKLAIKLGKMAYEYLMKGRLSFSEKELNNHCFDSEGVPLEFDEVAILEQQTFIKCKHINKTYQFIHPTFQELLAAWYLSQQTESFQINAIANFFKDNECTLDVFWMFYAGLTNLNSISFNTVLSSNSIHKLKYAIRTILIRDLGGSTMRPVNVRSIVKTFFTTKLNAINMYNFVSIDFQITLLAAVKESQNPQICRSLCNSYIFNMNTGVCWFTIPKYAMTPQILLSLSYFMAHSGKKWAIQFKKIDNNDVDHLLKYLSCNKSVDCPCNECSSLTDRTDNAIYALDTSSSQHSVDGLVKLVETQKYIQWIILSRSEFVNDDLMIKLAEALKQNTCLKMLHLFGCNITSVAIKAIANMLKENSTLEWIGLRDNKKTIKEEDIILLLETINSHNTTVYMLILDRIFHEAPKVQELLTTLNDSRNNETAKLCLKLEDSLRFGAVCNHISSFLSYLRTRGQQSGADLV